jgi:hypothetical protein
MTKNINMPHGIMVLQLKSIWQLVSFIKFKFLVFQTIQVDQLVLFLLMDMSILIRGPKHVFCNQSTLLE